MTLDCNVITELTFTCYSTKYFLGRTTKFVLSILLKKKKNDNRRINRVTLTGTAVAGTFRKFYSLTARKWRCWR